MNSTNPASQKITLSDTKEIESLQKLGELRWSLERIAAFFEWDLKALEAEMRDPESLVRKTILKGELQAAFDMESKLLSDARSGNQTSAKIFGDMVRERNFKLTKLDLFGGSEDAIMYEHIQKLIDTGTSESFTKNEQLYIEALQMVYSLQIRCGDRKTIKLLTKEPFSLSYERAKEVLSEAIELFNGGRRVSRDAMRYHIAESYDTIYHAIIEAAKTPQDYALAAGILDKKARLLKLDEPEAEAVKPELYPRKYIISSLSPAAIGLPPANRDVLGAQIDSLDIPDSERSRLKVDAGIEDFDIVKVLTDAVQEES